MFEGFQPTPKGIEIIRDYVIGKITLSELIKFAKESDCFYQAVQKKDEKIGKSFGYSLRDLDRDQPMHLEEEFDNYRKIYPVE